LSLEEKSVPADKVDTEHRAEALPHAPPSLLGVLTGAGGDTAVESETGEVRQLPKHGPRGSRPSPAAWHRGTARLCALGARRALPGGRGARATP
ncbi:unnamed protein product, partial [Bubo scandiacus]